MFGRHDRLLRAQLRHRFLVTTHDDETIDGVLVLADDVHLVLADAAAIAPDNSRLDLAGDVWIPRLEVKYLQQTKR